MSSTIASLAAPGLNITPLDISLRQESGHHTIALVSTLADVRTPLSQRSVLAAGAPVVLSWGTAPAQISTWYGYVHHYETSAEPGVSPTLTYVLIGTSNVLNDHASRTWQKATGSYVVRRIGSAAGFSTYTHKTGKPSTWIAQANQSDFEFLNGLAKQYGFTFWADGARMLFLDGRVLLASPATSSMPTASMNKQPGQQDSLLTFKLAQGPTVPGSGQVANRTTYGLDQTTGRLIRAALTTDQSARPRQLINASLPLGSYADAAASLAATTAANAQWIKAEAEMLGDTRLEPGGLVWLDGVAMPPKSQGMWLVEKAEHLVSLLTDTYTTRLRLTRNSATTQVVSQVLPYGAANGSQACVLDGSNHWRSALVREVVYER